MTIEEFFQENNKAAIAFSGGVDSAYLLYAAVASGADVSAYYVRTAFQPEWEYADAESLLACLRQQDVVGQFVAYATSKGVKRRNIQIQKSRKLLENVVYGNIIYNMLGIEEYTKYINQSDKTVQKALEVLREGKSYPAVPDVAFSGENGTK